MSEQQQEERTPTSSKYGRRVPVDSKDFDSAQQELEKYWRGLSEFRQFHKGRLDSANNEDLYSFGE